MKIHIEVGCAKCSNFCFNSLSFVEEAGTFRQLFCPICFESHHIRLTNILPTVCLQFLSNALKFSCLWNCGKFIKPSELDLHERSCEKSPRIKCPHGDCSFIHVIDKLRKHLSFVHDELLSYQSVHIYDKKEPENSIVKQYVFTHKNVLVACKITRNYSHVLIEVQCADKSINIENIRMYIEKRDSCKKKFRQTFVDESRMNLNVLPVVVYFTND